MFNFMKKADTAIQEAPASTTQLTFKDIRPQWKALAQERKITREDIAALCLYRALVKEQGKEGSIGRLQRAFKPITNKVKIDNGAYPYGALDSALWMVKNSTLITWLDEEPKQALLALAKEIKVKGGSIQ